MQHIHYIFRWLFHAVSWTGGVSLVLYYFLFHISSLSDNSLFNIALILPLYAVIIWFSFLVHELGHAMAAWSVGFRLDAFVCTPLKLERVNQKWRWDLVWKSNIPGYVLANPVTDQGFKCKYTLFALAGPMASLILAVASCALFFSYFDELDGLFTMGFKHKAGQSLWPFYLAGFSSLFNTIVVLLCSIPMVIPKANMLNDAAIVLWVLFHHSTRDLDLKQLIDNIAGGTRPRDLDRTKMLDCLGAPRTGSAVDGYTCLIGYYHFLDARQFSVAEVLLEQSVDNYRANSEWATPTALLEHIYFHAMYRKPLDNIADDLACCEKHAGVPRSILLRAKAAAHFAAGEHQQAMALAEEAAVWLKNQFDSTGYDAEREWIQEIINRIQTAPQNPTL